MLKASETNLPGGAAANSPQCVLVVEDDEGLRNLIQKALGRAGFTVQGAPTGAAAVALMLANPGQALLIDQKLPDMTGSKLVATLKERGIRAPFVIMTGQGSEQLAVELMKLGAYDYIVKSLEMVELFPVVFQRLFRQLETEQKLQASERDLRQREERLRTILHTAMDGFWRVDPQGRLLEVNQAYCRMSGYTEAELLALGISDLETVETAADVGAHLARVLTAGKDRFETCHRRKDGSRFEVEISVQCQPGEPGYTVAFLRDITQRKQAEAALRRSEQRFRGYFELPLIGIAITSPEKGWLEVNDGLCAMLAYPREELVVKTWAELTHPEDLAADASQFKRVLAGEIEGYCLDKRFLRKDGQTVWTSLAVRCVRKPDRTADYFVATLQDITERKKAEAQLLRKQEQLELAQRSAGAGMWDWDMATGKIEWSRELYGLFGLDPDRAGAGFDAWRQAVHPGDLQPASDRIEQAVKDGKPLASEYRVVLPTGGLRWISALGNTVSGPDGRHLRMSGICLDITERKLAEQELRQSEERFRKLFGRHSAIKLIIDPETGAILDANEAAAAFYGWPVAELKRMRIQEINTLPAEEIMQAKTLPPSRLEFRHRRADGSIRDVEVFSNKIELAGKDILFEIIHDITGRRQLEVQLRQSQKLEAIGQLAGGVAHDFNNIMAAIMMNLGLLETREDLAPEVLESVKELQTEAQRAANLTQQLLMFSRKSVLEKKVLDLNEVVANLLKMLGRLIGEPIQIQFNSKGDLPFVKVDQGMIEQVLLNLAVNARDAMPQGGQLAISLEALEVDAERIKGHAHVAPGAFVCIQVKDTGCGMDKATIDRIFEPFFTTKEVGKGTGMGLATVYGIMAQHKGWIEVESAPGHGAMFRVFFPASKEENAQPKPPAFSAAVARGDETVLVVEDAASVRRVQVKSLQSQGYLVFEAGNGPEALEVWRRHAREIDLLISDMVMPDGMTGMDLARELRKDKPGLKVIISSGYNAEWSGRDRAAAAGIKYLPKPYPLGELLKAVRDCLDQPPNAP